MNKRYLLLKFLNPLAIIGCFLFLSQPVCAEWYVYIHDTCMGSDRHLKEGPYSTQPQCESAKAQMPSWPCYKKECKGFDDASASGGGGGVLDSTYGEVNLDGYTKGKPFFSSGDASEFSDWIKESHLRWQAYLALNRELKEKGKSGWWRIRYRGKKDKKKKKPAAPFLIRVKDIGSVTESGQKYLEWYEYKANEYLINLHMRKTGPVAKRKIKKIDVPVPKVQEGSPEKEKPVEPDTKEFPLDTKPLIDLTEQGLKKLKDKGFEYIDTLKDKALEEIAYWIPGATAAKAAFDRAKKTYDILVDENKKTLTGIFKWIPIIVDDAASPFITKDDGLDKQYGDWRQNRGDDAKKRYFDASKEGWKSKK